MRIWAVALLGLMVVTGLLFLSSLGVLGVDFGPVWAAAREPAPAYDFQHVTLAQPWRLGSVEHPTLRPFAYPPTVLLLAAPLGQLQYAAAFAIWTALVGGAFLAAGRATGAPWWFMLATPVVQAVAVGQVTLLAAALVLAALVRPKTLLAGVALGVAACLKPHLLLLVPLALVAQGACRSLAMMMVTGLALCGLSALLFGIEAWTQWFDALRRFAALVLEGPYLASVITPYGFLARQGIDPRWAFLLVVPVAMMVWRTFSRSDNVHAQTIALGAGGLLIGTYALSYDLALLAPAMAAIFLRGDRRSVLSGMAFAIAAWPAGILAIFAALAGGIGLRPRG